MTVLSGVLVMIALLSMLCVISGGAMRLLIAFFIIAGTVIIFIWLHQHKSFMDDVGILIKEIHEVSDGNTLKESAVPDDSMLYAAGEDLTHVYENLNSSVERQVKSEKMKVDLAIRFFLIASSIISPFNECIKIIEVPLSKPTIRNSSGKVPYSLTMIFNRTLAWVSFDIKSPFFIFGYFLLISSTIEKIQS